MIKENTIKKTLAFMLEYQQLVLNGVEFTMNELTNKHSTPTAVPSMMKELGYADYNLINKRNIINKKVIHTPFERTHVIEVLKLAAKKSTERRIRRKAKQMKSKEEEVSAGDLYKVKLLVEYINKNATLSLISSTTLKEALTVNKLTTSVIQILIDTKVISFHNTCNDDTILYKVNLLDPTPVTCRSLWLKIKDYYIGNESKLNKMQWETPIEKNKTQKVMDKIVGNTTEEKTIKLTIDKAKALYQAFPEMRNTILAELTDEELGIDTFPKTWEEVEQALSNLDVECHVIDSSVRYISEVEANQADATNKLQWIAYYLNSKVEEEAVKHFAYVANNELRMANYTNNHVSNEIIFFSKKNLERSLTEHKELWNKYFRI